MKSFKVALLQLLPGATQEENRLKGISACRTAKEMGADIALFPEMWNNGYTIVHDPVGLAASAVSNDSAFIRSFAALARELNMAIALTFLESFSPSPRNAVCVFDRFGEEILYYAKVHTCDFGDERVLTPGDGFKTAALNTRDGDVMLGAMICYDREFPESARILMLQGAEIILVPNACPMEINRISQLRGRAYENMVGIATANYPAGKSDCNGHSTAFDGIAYRPDESGSRDTLIIEASEQEGIYLANFPLDELREYRNLEVHGNAYRRPEKYGMLLNRDIKDPFIRDDYRK